MSFRNPNWTLEVKLHLRAADSSLAQVIAIIDNIEGIDPQYLSAVRNLRFYLPSIYEGLNNSEVQMDGYIHIEDLLPIGPNLK